MVCHCPKFPATEVKSNFTFQKRYLTSEVIVICYNVIKVHEKTSKEIYIIYFILEGYNEIFLKINVNFEPIYGCFREKLYK